MGKRIEEKVSLTARFTCLIRALSYYENKTQYRSEDYIAPMLLHPLLNRLAKLKVFGSIFRFFAPKGIYEYVIARTKYIDEALKTNGPRMEQVLLLGAGFDSRSVRLNDILKHAVFFELDSPVTQNAKIRILNQKKIEIPSNVVYIPLDFEKDSVSEKLDANGFQRGKKCFFLLEGLTMYLNANSIEDTFQLISDYAGAGSIVVFDYVHQSVIRHENKYEGEKKLSTLVSAFGEKWSFGFEKDKISDYLLEFGLLLADQTDSIALKKRYFTKDQLNIHVNETHSVVTARKL